MAFNRKRHAEEPRIDLTPMVDCVFLLLIFFMISTTFIETPGISVKLPESSSTVVEKAPDEVKVYLSREGVISVQEKRLSLIQLRDLLRSYGERSAKMTFFLLADRQARHGQVVELMDAAREAGFGKLAIATEQRRPQ